MDDGTPKLRVLIRAPVQQIPCEPNQRAWKLWDLFCETVYRRDARYAGDESCPEFGTEELHLLSNYDSENDVKAWFMTDVGVKKERRSVDAGTVPLEVYRAAYDTTNERWVFKLLPPDEKVQNYCSRYAWGGSSISNNDDQMDEIIQE